MIQLAAVAAGHKSLLHDSRVHSDRLLVFDAQVRCDRVRGVKTGRLAHGFVQKQRDDPAMKKARAALVLFSQAKTSHDALSRVILFESEAHPARVRAAATKAGILGFWIEPHGAALIFKPIHLASQ